MNYRYTQYTVEPTRTIPDGIIHRPEVLIRIVGARSEAFLLALVDTGADETIVPISVADEIGVELHAGHAIHAGSVTGAHIELVPGQVELELMSNAVCHRWSDYISFARFAREEDECAILGHAGALQYFTATFDGEGHQGSLLPNGTLPATQ